MEELCENLDEFTIQFFSKFESLQRKRQALSDAVRDGHLNLSMARYSMGNKAVCSLQYSHRMDHALYHIEDDEGLSFGFKKVNPGESLSSKGALTDKEPENAALRRRKPTKREPEGDNAAGPSQIDDLSTVLESVDLSKPSGERSAVVKVQDPIKWFGVLVPSSLREGQRHFQSAIELCCEVTTLEAELRQVVVKIERLKGEKRRLLQNYKEKSWLQEE